MELQYVSGVPHTFQTITFATLVFAAWVLLSKVNYKSQLAKLPELVIEGASSEKKRINYMNTAKQLYADGYRKFRDRLYRISTTDGIHRTAPTVYATPMLMCLRSECCGAP